MIAMPTDPRFENLVGRVFGRLTVASYEGHARGGHTWLCVCSCGSSKSARGGHLKAGRTTSCGCFSLETSSTHGGSGTPEYHSWEAMKGRCLNPHHSEFRHYGGRGITVCARWLAADGFANFLADMGPRPAGRYTIERRDNNGHYEPGNCAWANMKQQSRNKRTNHLMTLRGETLPLVDWAARLGMPPETLHKRLRLGWTVERTLTQPRR